jgi:uncharacterized protein YkwD
VVDTANFDTERFNQYVLDEVNKLRIRERVDTLIEDHSLDAASQDHADYMAENNVLSHAQKEKLKNKPYDRVLYHGGTHNSVGENIQIVPINYMFEKSKGKLTYQKLAKEVVSNWKKSAGHFKNMVRKDFAGVSHSYAFNKGMMYCCQVFGSKPFEEKYEFTKGPELFVKDKKECLNCKKVQKKINKDQGHLGWYSVSNDSIYYENTSTVGKNKKNLKKIFSANGAIALDVIHQEQFDCSGNQSFHNSLYHDGYYIGYVSKASLKDDIDPSPDLVKIFVGMKPVFVDTFFQVDFNLVKKWRPCMHGMTIYVNPDFLKPEEYFEIPYPTVVSKNIVIKDSVEVKIAFESGQTDENKEIFKPLIAQLDSITNSDYQISSIYFNGVASVEGSKDGNEQLFSKRGEIIQAYLKEYYPDFELKSEFFENFDDFRSGLVSMGVAEATYMSEDSLRMYANQHRSEKRIMDLLDETRYSSINIVFEDIIPLQQGGYALSVQRLQDLIDDKNYREMVPIYEILANHVMDGDNVQQDSLLNIRIPDSPEFAQLHWYDFVLRLNLDDSPVSVEELNTLTENGAIPNTSDLLEYRLMFNIFNENEAIDVSDFGEVFPLVRGKKQQAWIECLELISGVQNYRYSPKMVAPILFNTAQKKKFDIKKTYFICQYLIDWGYTTEPYILLSKYAKRPGRIPKLYKQYLKLGYFLGRFNDKKEWKKIRNVFKNLAKDNPEEFCDLFRWDQMGVRALQIPEIAELFCEKCRSDS